MSRYDDSLRVALPVVRARIEAARTRAGTKAVTIVAVTKGHGADAVRAARAAGLLHCGENRVQELESKVAELGRVAVTWHLIGHLQRNKARKALPLFDLIHSVDNLELAQVLDREAARANATVRALVQVNTSGEESKGGFSEDEVVDAVAQICALPHLRIDGLMTMAPLTEDEALIRMTFARARRAFDRCAKDVAGFTALHLSMGMSHDFEAAIEEGSTMVRLGTVLLGERA
jgi:pyridoxal phosphate enzyme (YggS family)